MTVMTSELIPIADFAKTLGISAQTIKDWRETGRLNIDRTKRVKLKLKKMTYGWGISQKMYEDFITKLNDDS